MKTQDLHYVSMLKHMNERKLEGLRAVLPQSLANQDAHPEHILFAGDEEERSAILAERCAEIEDASGAATDTEEKPVRKASAALREFEIRKQRIDALSLAERNLQTQKHMMQPGRRKIVGQDEYEQPIFKWKAQRKK
jgi:hypothetical protein